MSVEKRSKARIIVSSTAGNDNIKKNPIIQKPCLSQATPLFPPSNFNRGDGTTVLHHPPAVSQAKEDLFTRREEHVLFAI